MTYDELVQAVQSGAFLMFTALLIAGALSTAVRVAQMRRRGWPMPLLLWRDLALMLGLSVPFSMILVARATDATPTLYQELSWVLMTSVPAIAALAVYVYFELRIIGRR